MLVGICVSTSMVSANAIASPATLVANKSAVTSDSLTYATSVLRSCRSHNPRHCGLARAHFSRLRQMARREPAAAVSGTTITWKRVAGVTGYVLARKDPGQPYRYSVISSTRVTPRVSPGKTVAYRVRTEVPGSAWSSTVAITYPPGEGATSSPDPSSISTGSANISSSPRPTSTGTVSNNSVTAPTTTEPFIKGICEELDGWGEAAVPEVAEEIHNLGADWVRVDLRWKEVMPSPGVYDWSSFDKVVQNARSYGLHLLPILDYAPSWTEPSNAAAYAEFVAAAVARYGPGTTANLQWFELWNEPYFSYAWSGKTPEPEAYARDVAAASQAARQIAPSVKLLLEADYSEAEQTGTSPLETSWIEDMFIAEPNLGSMVNGIAVHPYGDDPSLPLAANSRWTDTAGNWAFQRIDTIREEFLAHGVNLPFWITEEGWSTWEVTEATQAKYYADLAAQVAERPWITALFPYTLRENEAKPINNQSQFGLLRYGSWEPKLAYYALREAFGTLS